MLVAYCGGSGRLDLWPGWCFAAFFLLMLAASYLVLDRVAPDLLVERVSLNSGAMPGDTAIVGWLALSPILTCLAAGLDARRNGINDDVYPVVIGYLLAIGVSVLTQTAIAANRFYAPLVRIQNDRGHKVVRGGPYQAVRHPGNLGNVALNLGSPLMLASSWAWIPAGISIVLIVVRTAREDHFLRRELPGYDGYARLTRHRLIPGLW
jgi:protein-S-isoprenylcysteine O-methyltransferase Ste14